MSEILFAILTFAALCTASLLTQHLTPRLPDSHRSDETNTVVRLVASLFVVITSLVFGLLINSSRTSFERLDESVHSYSTRLILLDRTLRAYGPEADGVRGALQAYVRTAIENPARIQSDETLRSYAAEQSLDAVGEALAGLAPTDPHLLDLAAEARQQLHGIVEQRWSIIEAGQRSFPVPITAMLVAWLLFIFACFGYRAPRNAVTCTMFVAAAALISGSILLVLDMNRPFSGPIRISDMPLHQALAEVSRSR